MKRFFLPLVLVLAFAVRIFALSDFPRGFTPDEASFGYDAYSLLKTGSDQWGHRLPIVFESFGDYKAPLYAYLSVPFVSVFGLERWVIRLPNAFFSVLAVYLTYLLTIELLRKTKSNIPESKFKLLGVIAAFLLAISPWHIMMSRGAFEANLTTFLLPLSLYLFLKGLVNPKLLIMSSVIIGLNVFSYHSARFVTPLIFIFLIFIYRHELFRKITSYHKVSALVLLFFVGLTVLSVKSGSLGRVKDVNIFKLSLMEASSDRIKAINNGMNPRLARVIHNKYFAGVRHFTSSYLLYISPQFYFINGAGEGTYGMIPGRGVLYWFELPLLIMFLVYAVKNPNNNLVRLIIFWILVSPIPAALSIGPGYAANRAVITLPAIQIALALGVIELVKLIKSYSERYFKCLVRIYVIVVMIFFASFLEDYFILSPFKTANNMLYGNLEVAAWLRGNSGDQNVIVSRGLSEPHIYMAFADKTDPYFYQKATKNWNYKNLGLGWVDQMPEYSFGKYLFTGIDYLKFKSFTNTLLVGRPNEFPETVIPLKIIYYPNGDPAIYVVSPTEQKYAEKI